MELEYQMLCEQLGFTGDDIETVVNELNRRTNNELTAGDFAEWLEPSGCGDYEKFHAAVKDLLGTNTCDFYEQAARLPSKLFYELGIETNTTCGGVDLTLTEDQLR